MKYLFIKSLLVYFLVVFNCCSQTILVDKWITVNEEGTKILDSYYSKGVKCVWEGLSKDGKAHGFGTLTKYKNGSYESTYEGEYRNGIREGKGKFTHREGDVLEGVFVNNQATGYGTRTSSNSAKYTGNFINYRQHGVGVYVSSKKIIYDGYFVSDRLYTGKVTYPNNEIQYLEKYRRVDSLTPEENNEYNPVLDKELTEYFDENWKRCLKNNASFYRLITYKDKNTPIGEIKDYFITGEIQSVFTAIYLDYNDHRKCFKEGKAIYYYKNGNLQQVNYFYNNKRNGKFNTYYSNGQLASEINYIRGYKNGSYFEYSKTGKLEIIANYEYDVLEDDKYITMDDQGNVVRVYEEDFYNNYSIWELEFEKSTSKINSDHFIELNNLSNMALRFVNIPLDQNIDFSVSILLSQKQGFIHDAYGLLMGFKDWDNYYFFSVTPDGDFSITGYENGVANRIKDWTYSPHVKEKNKLEIVKTDEGLAFYINDSFITATDKIVLQSNDFGMISGTDIVIMEKLVAKEFLTKYKITKAEKVTAKSK